MTTENIITKISRKNVTGFDTPYFIGSAAKYISGIRGVTSNNIEENILLGCDSITTEERLADGTKHVVREYRTEEQNGDFYLIDLYIYQNNSSEKRWFYGDGLYLPEDIDDNIYDSERLIGVDTSVYSIDDNDDLLSIINIEESQEFVISKATLKFINSSGDIIPVAEKVIYAKRTKNGKTTQKQVVTNLL